MTGERDRDQTGRARNARPRDALGRPLPRMAAGEPTMPDDLRLPPGEALDLAEELLRSDHPFHAHEVLEASWKSAPSTERDLWQGLAQVAVGLTHAQRGNARGAASLLRRGAQRLRDYSDSSASTAAHGADLAHVIESAEDLANRIERDGPHSVTPAELRLRLQTGP
jgi:uncharacterized protein